MAEKEYIERKALIKYAEKQEVIIKDGLSIADAMRIQGNVFRRCVETCPAADVVEVVRCKDCKYFRTKPNYCSVLASDNINKDFYCESGERKEYDNDT